jgi:glutamate dehydrogenase
MKTIQNKNTRINDVGDHLKELIPENQQAHFSVMVDEIFSHVAAEDLLSYQSDDLKGLMATLFREIQSSPANVSLLFNPSVEEHSWQSSHTILILHHTDIRYLIDSIRNTLSHKKIKIHTLFHAYFSVERNQSGEIINIGPQDKKLSKKDNHELLMYMEIDHHSDIDTLREFNKLINKTINDVQVVAEDYPKMLELIDKASTSLDKHAQNINPETLTETKAFLDWIKNGHFTFLAYDEYKVVKKNIVSVPNTGVGLFRLHDQPKTKLFEEMSNNQIEAANTNSPILFAKSGRLSTVHRAAYSDYIIIRKFNAQGEIIGGFRFMGLYKHNVYLNSAIDIPLIRQKIQSILDRSGIPENTYNYAELSHILGTFPRDELFQANAEHLLDVGLNVLYIQERRKVRLFLRESIDKKFISAIFYAPRDRLNSKLTEQVKTLISSYLDIESSTTSTWLSESTLARCRFVFKLKSPLEKPLDQYELEYKTIELARDWDQDLQAALSDFFGEEKGVSLYQQYRDAFPAGYMDENNPRIAVADIDRMQTLSSSDNHPLGLSFYRAITPESNELKIKIYRRGEQLSLSDMIPVLENFGLQVIEEFPYPIEHETGTFWIYNFTVDFPFNRDIETEQFQQLLSDAFTAVWLNQTDNDAFNQLILKAGLNWRQINMLRAYSRYMKQIAFGFSQKFISSSLSGHTDIVKKLIAFFDCRFNPEKNRSEKTAIRLAEQLNTLFENVASLSEDRILRFFLQLMQATLRTNFFQIQSNNDPKEYISLKLDPHQIKDIPLPRPKYEIFVYSPRVEGVHLRGGKVARGGLRWSDRTEDFRTEILGLVKAQQVKNAVIVPVGAKGGFIAKQLPAADDREAFLKEGIACYQFFIRGLLDITDNIIDGNLIKPKATVCYDDDDTYLVVAADKGTATFSDIANEISHEYRHWLGDAFASGGSNGYDHKKMGITARGAWVSVQRHFREMNIDVQKQSFSVVGIGDMSGDVFGNGMLLSEQIKLVGAFNHLHIFIDPNPEPLASFEERQRLFKLPRSSWEDYNQKLISKGGGIFSRSAKSIILTKEIKNLINTENNAVTPTELISLLLKADVDMLWNGGIGTYVKASSEHHSEVGDKTNDTLRINASELRCKVVGEGGNLGLTQKARIEYALLGGSNFTDFIDNAGGVDCSDHEVNIKILLNQQVADGELTEKQRNRHLEKMTDSVAKLVLHNNYQQTQAIALAHLETVRRTEEYRSVIQSLESTGKLNRALEFLPDDETLSERKSQNMGLSQPELSILIAYTKADMKEALMHTDLGDSIYLEKYLESAFPAMLKQDFAQAIQDHPLRKEIIATQIANDMFNFMGISFVDRMYKSTGASHSDIAKAYVAAKEILSLSNIWQSIENLDHQIPSDLQYSLMLRSSRMVRRATRWIIQNHRTQLDISSIIDLYRQTIHGLESQLYSLLPIPLAEQWQIEKDFLVKKSIPDKLATTLASCDYLYDFLGIVAASHKLNKDINSVAMGFFTIAEKMDLDDFSRHLETKMPTTTHWQVMARESLRDDLEWQHRRLTENFLSHQHYQLENMSDNIDQWLQQQELLVNRWKQLVIEINNHNDSDMAIFSIAVRELSNLSQATSQT